MPRSGCADTGAAWHCGCRRPTEANFAAGREGWGGRCRSSGCSLRGAQRRAGSCGPSARPRGAERGRFRRRIAAGLGFSVRGEVSPFWTGADTGLGCVALRVSLWTLAAELGESLPTSLPSAVGGGNQERGPGPPNGSGTKISRCSADGEGKEYHLEKSELIASNHLRKKKKVNPLVLEEVWSWCLVASSLLRALRDTKAGLRATLPSWRLGSAPLPALTRCTHRPAQLRASCPKCRARWYRET